VIFVADDHSSDVSKTRLVTNYLYQVQSVWNIQQNIWKNAINYGVASFGLAKAIKGENPAPVALIKCGPCAPPFQAVRQLD